MLPCAAIRCSALGGKVTINWRVFKHEYIVGIAKFAVFIRINLT